MRPNNLAAIFTGVAACNVAQHAHRRATLESGFDEWAAAFRSTAAEATKHYLDETADALTILHC